ncbi:hypothetical protein WA588_002582 [Blastocystis sp. NMH]
MHGENLIVYRSQSIVLPHATMDSSEEYVETTSQREIRESFRQYICQKQHRSASLSVDILLSEEPVSDIMYGKRKRWKSSVDIESQEDESLQYHIPSSPFKKYAG